MSVCVPVRICTCLCRINYLFIVALLYISNTDRPVGTKDACIQHMGKNYLMRLIAF